MAGSETLPPVRTPRAPGEVRTRFAPLARGAGQVRTGTTGRARAGSGAGRLTLQLARDRAEVVDDGVGVEADRLGEVEQFHHVDAPPPALHGGDHRLVAPEARREVRLAEAGGLAVFDEKFRQAALARRA